MSDFIKATKVVSTALGLLLRELTLPSLVWRDAAGDFRGLELLGRHFLEHRVLDHLLIEKVRKLERRHRQQLDRLLQRRRHDQPLGKFEMKFLFQGHNVRGQRRKMSAETVGPLGAFIRWFTRVNSAGTLRPGRSS